MMVSMGAWRASRRGRSVSFEGRRAATGAIVEDADGTENTSLPGGLRAPSCCPGITPLSHKAPTDVVHGMAVGRTREVNHTAARRIRERRPQRAAILACCSTHGPDGHHALQANA